MKLKLHGIRNGSAEMNIGCTCGESETRMFYLDKGDELVPANRPDIVFKVMSVEPDHVFTNYGRLEVGDAVDL